MRRIYFEKVRKVKNPSKAYALDAGIDFYVPEDLGWLTKQIFHHELIPSGIKITIPPGFCMVFLNKSGVARDGGVMGAQVIDAGYTGEVGLHLVNIGDGASLVKAGQKLAQGLILPVPEIELKQINTIEGFNTKLSKHLAAAREEAGFGSTQTAIVCLNCGHPIKAENLGSKYCSLSCETYHFNERIAP